MGRHPHCPNRCAFRITGRLSPGGQFFLPRGFLLGLPWGEGTASPRNLANSSLNWAARSKSSLAAASSISS